MISHDLDEDVRNGFAWLAWGGLALRLAMKELGERIGPEAIDELERLIHAEADRYEAGEDTSADFARRGRQIFDHEVQAVRDQLRATPRDQIAH